MPNASTILPAAVAERPAAQRATPRAADGETAQRRRQHKAIGFDPLPSPFDAVAPVRLVTASGKVVKTGAPWAKNCVDTYRLPMNKSSVYRDWHDGAVGPVIDTPSRGEKWCHVTVCAMKDHGGSLAPIHAGVATPDTLAVFVSTNSKPPFTSVLFAEGCLGLAHLLRTLKPLMR